jgi:cell division protein FtsN
LAKAKTSPTRSRRTWSAALLLMALLALVLGVFGAVYFQGKGLGAGPQIANNEPAQPQTQPPAVATPQAQPPQAATPSENKPQDQATASPDSGAPAITESAPETAQAPPGTSAPTTPGASEILPQTQAATAPPAPDSEAQRLSQISPSAAPANVASAAPRYWVEFGAYEGAYYADRLKQSLSRLGIDVTVADVPGKNGRTYLRVRTAGDSDHATAAAQRAKAQVALHITPLLHRAAAISPAPARAPEAQAKPATKSGYWVQFGAFRERRNAEIMLSKLHKKDLQGTVSERKNGDLRPLYLVRVAGLSSYAQATQTAQLGGSVTHTSDAFIGQDRPVSSRPSHGLNPRPPTR